MSDNAQNIPLSVSGLPPEEQPQFSAPAPEIEGYQILDKLGEAGQGQVWRAVQLSTQRQVALKVPRIGLLSSRKALARFEREVGLAARLKHPHIVRIIDSGVRRGLSVENAFRRTFSSQGSEEPRPRCPLKLGATSGTIGWSSLSDSADP